LTSVSRCAASWLATSTAFPVEIRVAGIVRGNGGMSNRRQIRDHERVALICGLTADGGQNFAIP